MHTQNPIRLLLRNNLHKSVRIQIRFRSRVGCKVEFSNTILHTVGFEFLFGFSDPGYFGVSVYDGGNCVVVDVSVTGFDVFDGCDTCVFG